LHVAPAPRRRTEALIQEVEKNFDLERSLSDQAERIAVQRENSTLCAGLRLAPETESYARCMDGLTEITSRQDERRNEEALGIL
jgi:hypothetical protein